MGVLKEFKEFAMRGNVIDLAVGVVIGAAFGKIVTALVEKVIMPPIGLMIGGIDFSKLVWVLAPARIGADGKEIPPVVIAYGDFINTIIQFIIIAFAIFMVIKVINRLTHHHKAAAGPSEEVLLLREIRDSLKHDPVPRDPLKP
ncbi:MAG TPA: large-conductance mechanosensitive channel protein MscL [Stenotrophomonas sp.]